MFDRPSRLPLRRTRQQKTNRSTLVRTWRIIATVTLVALASVYVTFAQISLSTSVPYTQNFTSMGIPLTNPAPSALPVDFRQDTIAAARTLGSFSSASTQTARVGGANVSTIAANGSYNFGAGTSTLGDADRAPGFISSGTATQSGNLYAQFINNTGSPLSGLQVSYDVEKYRNGSNPAGFRYQLFYSLDGNSWTNAGPDFFTSFPADADNNGFATAPGATVSIGSKTINVPVANGAHVYLAWNYSVVSGTTTTNAQALAIDNVSVLGIGNAAPTDPTGIGAANPNSVLPGETSTLTVSVTPGANPTSTGLTVAADLSSIGGSASQQLFDDGINGGDVVAGDHVFTYTATVALLTTPGPKSLPFTVSDNEARSANGTIGLTVQQPPQPVDHLVISQLYGGGGNSSATFTHDYIEIYNPTGISFNLAGWSLQYASATGTSWTNKQPLGGTIAPGEYFLVRLASGGANGAPLPVTANITGDINMSATTGKIALVSNSISLSGSCPNATDPDIVDFLGYGSSASCFEGGARAPAPGNTTALFRKLNGGQDTNQNGDDFQTAAPNPRRTAPIVELGPWVAGTEPISDGFNAPYDATVTVDFSEPVDVTGNWFDITCASSGQHNSATVATYNSSKGFHITPNTGFQFGEQCTVTIFHANVHDQDLDDSSPNTDTLFADHVWTFTVVAAGAPAPHQPSVHLAFGNPSNAVADLQQDNNYLMEKPSFSLSYNRDKGTPNWVSWHLENDWTGNLPRTDTFRADPAVSPDWYRVQSTDYFASGFDRGHMTPNADRDNPASIPLNQETFLMSNMVPQAPDNNQGPWADLESFLRTLLPGNEVYIVAGPAGVGGVGNNGPADTIANGHVTVPAYTWKVALVIPFGDDDVSRVSAATRTIAVIMPNQNSINTDWHTYLTTVDAVETLTGYDFFENVPDIVENSIEAGINGNNPPGTDNQFATTAEDVPGDIMLNVVSAAASPTFTYTIVTPPSHGILSGGGPTFTYTPAQNFNGSDSFTFKVNDGTHDSNTSTVNITITEVNDAPVATGDSANTNEDSHVDLSAIDLASNDSTGPANESLQSLMVTSVSATANTHGAVSLSNGIVTYTPDANFNGAASFEYQVCDNGNTNGSPDPQCATGVVNVTVDPINDAPKANSQSVTTNSNTPVAITLTGNDLETSTAELVFEVTVSPTHGSLSGSGANRTYTPNANYSGPDSFRFTVRDAGDGTAPPLTSAAATVSITVNDTVAPVINAPANVTVNTGAGATACATVVTETQLGTATATDNAGSVSIARSGVPAGNVFPVGRTTITYTATDDAGNSSTATQTVTVIDNTVPTITGPAPTSVRADANGHALIPNVVAGTTASDNCGPVTITQSPVAGTVVGVGIHTITITAKDAAGNTSTATTTFTVIDGRLTFSIAVSPNPSNNGKTAKVDIVYTNTTKERLTVSFVVRYTGPCDSGLVGQMGPVQINPETTKTASMPFQIQKTACTGPYILTLEAYIGNVLVGTTTTDLTVAPETAATQ
ncbi:MAG TPA: DNA/RNA non-specific endonuclease [Pyrinomonadaceae bacterium]|nr:DNA/RNA non-specific endonuclease [Pyrinomonadaceae bacterium]